MKRSAPLQRRTPLKPGKPLARGTKPLQRRTRLRPRSRKMAAKIRQLIPLYVEFLALPGHEWCEFPLGCGKRSTCVHHRRGRIGELLFDKLFWAGSCDFHNQYAEDETGHSLEIGWLLLQFGLLPDESEAA